MNRQLRGSLLLLLTAAIWGAAFVAQRMGMDHLGPMSFNGIRMILAGVALLPVLAWRKLRPERTGAEGSREPDGNKTAGKREQWTAGLLCGLLLFVSSTLQQFGLVETTAGKAGFITALYVVLVPVVNYCLFRKTVSRWVILSVGFAVAGLFLICVPAGQIWVANRGDLLVLGCAVCFTGHILVVDAFSSRTDALTVSCTQFFVCGILSMIGAWLTETITWEGIRAAAFPIIYAGVLSGAVGYTLQIVAQKDTNPTVASLLMCLEAVFALLTGALLLGERMTSRESIGCVIMFAAVILAQIPHRSKTEKHTQPPAENA